MRSALHHGGEEAVALVDMRPGLKVAWIAGRIVGVRSNVYLRPCQQAPCIDQFELGVLGEKRFHYALIFLRQDATSSVDQTAPRFDERCRRGEYARLLVVHLDNPI